MSQGRTPVLTGGCQCGAVRYALYAMPERVHLCHCRMCQKAVGNVFAALAPVRLEDFAWTRDDPAFFRSSSVAQRGFCATCGTPLTFGYTESEWIDPTIGSLDEPERVRPGVHYGVESKLDWLRSIHQLPEKETEKGGITGAGSVLVNFQHPDHETPRGWRPPRAGVD